MENPMGSCRFCGNTMPREELADHELQCGSPSTTWASRLAAITSGAIDVANNAAASLVTSSQEMASTAQRFAAFTTAWVIILTALHGLARTREGEAANPPNAAINKTELFAALAIIFSQLEIVARFMSSIFLASTAQRFVAFTTVGVIILTTLRGRASVRDGEAANRPNASSSAISMAELFTALATIFSQLEIVARFMSSTIAPATNNGSTSADASASTSTDSPTSADAPATTSADAPTSTNAPGTTNALATSNASTSANAPTSTVAPASTSSDAPTFIDALAITDASTSIDAPPTTTTTDVPASHDLATSD